MISTTNAELRGFCQTALGVPSMLIPVFGVNNHWLIQDTDRRGLVAQFKEIEPPTGQICVNAKAGTFLAVGDPPIYALGLDSSEVISGDKETFSKLIDFTDPRLAESPELRADLAEFVGNSDALRAALAEIEAKIGASSSQIEHGQRETEIAISDEQKKGPNRTLEKKSKAAVSRKQKKGSSSSPADPDKKKTGAVASRNKQQGGSKQSTAENKSLIERLKSSTLVIVRMVYIITPSESEKGKDKKVFIGKQASKISVGDKIQVYARVWGDGRARLEVFKGTVLSKTMDGRRPNFTVRTNSNGEDHDQVFHLPKETNKSVPWRKRTTSHGNRLVESRYVSK